MPRKSAAALAVRTVAGPLEVKRLLAPAHLSEAERAIWLEVVNDQPADAFTATHAPLLELYCRHIVQARILADELAVFDRAWLADDDGLKRYDRLLGMAEREGRAASSLATRLRITRQAVDQQTVARAMVKDVKRKPWELPAS
jgi:hypothetical protein